ncbi:MAG: ABC transporter permease [Alphaproteobacteria bacterium]|nr:ABC transporter permease [Alphaproteobacteria bacterium]
MTTPASRDDFALPDPVAFSAQRVKAMLLRHLFVFRRSWPRIIELLYWPIMNMTVWGFLTLYLLKQSSWLAQATGVFISGVLLWDVLFRTNLGVALSFIEEMWARNLGQLFVSPLRAYELMASVVAMGTVRALIAVLPAGLLALPFYDFWVFSMGPPLYVFFLNLLVMGWWVGLFVSAVVLRFGLSAESICWAVLFLLAPISCVYYPVEVLPAWLQPVALAVPATHVFEGMRAVLFGEGFRAELFWAAAGLNALYGALSAAFFLWMFEIARRRGLLLKQGE